LGEALLARGVIGRPLPHVNSVAFSPPLVISDDEIDELIAATEQALGDVAALV
jgi:L-2,4-diaminobutyrate transaminase